MKPILIKSKYGNQEVDRRKWYTHYTEAVAAFGADFVDPIIEELDDGFFVNTSDKSSTCATRGHSGWPQLRRNSDDEIVGVLTMSGQEQHCREVEAWAYYTTKQYSTSTVDNILFSMFVDKHFPELKTLFKVEFYGFNHQEDPDVYINGYKDAKDPLTSVYVPLSAFLHNDASAIDARVEYIFDYYGEEKATSFTQRPLYKAVKNLISGKPVHAASKAKFLKNSMFAKEEGRAAQLKQAKEEIEKVLTRHNCTIAELKF